MKFFLAIFVAVFAAVSAKDYMYSVDTTIGQSPYQKGDIILHVKTRSMLLFKKDHKFPLRSKGALEKMFLQNNMWDLQSGARFGSDIKMDDIKVHKIVGVEFEWKAKDKHPAPISVAQFSIIPEYLPRGERDQETVRYCYNGPAILPGKRGKMHKC